MSYEENLNPELTGNADIGPEESVSDVQDEVVVRVRVLTGEPGNDSLPDGDAADPESLLNAISTGSESENTPMDMQEALAGFLDGLSRSEEMTVAAILALSAGTGQPARETEEEPEPGFCDIHAETLVDPVAPEAALAVSEESQAWIPNMPEWIGPEIQLQLIAQEPPAVSEGPALDADESHDEIAAPIEALVAQIDEELGEAEVVHSSAAAENTGITQQIIFLLSGTRYAVSIGEVLEMSTVPRTTPIPNVPEFVRGVTNLRGEILAVLDLRTVLGLTPGSDAQRERMIVVRPSGSDAAAGLIVDSVRGLAKIANQQLRQPAGPLEDTVIPYLAGVTEYEDQVLHALDLRKLFRAPEIASLAAH